MAKSVQSEEVTCPSCELMRGRSRRFVDEDHASGEKVLKITFHGWTTEIRVALVGIIEDDDHVHASSMRFKTDWMTWSMSIVDASMRWE